jgi:transposase
MQGRPEVLRKDITPVPMSVEVVDAIVGVNTHRATREVQLVSPAGTPIATVSISKDSAGYSDLLAWIVTHAPGPRLAVPDQASSSYAAGLARAVAAAGLVVVEPAESDRKQRRGRGQSDRIDMHIAAMTAVHRDADQLGTPPAVGDRDALRILLGARQDLTATTTRQSTRLRALLLGGDDTDRRIARAAFTEAALISLARRPEPREASRRHSVRHAEIRRLALVLIATGRELTANSMQLQTIVDDLAPGLTDQRGIGPVSAAQAIVSWSHPSTVPNQRRPPALEVASLRMSADTGALVHTAGVD